jgi:flagellar assembly protein FliH
MALIKHTAAADLSRRAVVLDLGDLQRQGERIIEAARQRAEAIVREAHAERDRLIAGAAERGFQEGLAKGLAEGEARGREHGLARALEDLRPRLEALERSWSEALARFQAERESMLREAESGLLRLAIAIAEKVIRRTIAADPSVVADLLRTVMALVVRPTSLRISIHPADRPVLAAAMPGLLAEFPAISHAELADDPSLEPGSCLVRALAAAEAGAPAVAGEIDATIATQVGRIAEVLVPARPAAIASEQGATP